MSTDRRPDEHAVDEVVDRAWRAASQTEPPARIDAAIIEAARLGVRGPSQSQPPAGRRPRWTGWQPLAAAAGVVGLAFVLVQSLPHGPEPVPPHESAATTASAPESAAESTPDLAAESVSGSVPDSVPAPTTAPLAPVSGGLPAPTADTADAAAPSAPPPAVSAEATALSAAAPRGAERAAAAAPARESTASTHDAWVQRIVELHAAGDTDAAVAALHAFRAAYPDADEHLPTGLRSWASAVPTESEP